MILAGSEAIKHWYSDFPRIPKDKDYIVPELMKIVIDRSSTKVEKCEYLVNPIFNDYRRNVMGSNDLLTLKMSHMMWDINWEKHMWDIQFLLKKSCVVDVVLFWRLYDYWNTVHSKNKRSDLKMSKEDFFNNSINYNENEHDEIHKILNPIPIYTKCLKDGCDVELDGNKFDQLSYEDKLEFVREEVYVMAYERYMGMDFRRAYGKMLKKFIISHAPKFSLIFILENYIELHVPKYNYFNKIDNEIKIKLSRS